MDGTSFFRTTTIAFTDASGQRTGWAVAAPATNGNNWLLVYSSHTILLANPALNRTSANAFDGSGTQLASDNKSGTTLNTAAVFSAIATTTSVEAFVDNASDGSTALSGTLFSGTSSVDIGNVATGPFYGAWMEKGVADSTTKTTAQTYGAALHP
jgi:hypothetical protein